MWKVKDVSEQLLSCVLGREHVMISYDDASDTEAEGEKSRTQKSGGMSKPDFEKCLAEKLFPELKIVKVGCTALTTPTEFLEGITLGLRRRDVLASSPSLKPQRTIPRIGATVSETADTDSDSDSTSSQSSNTFAVVISPTRDEDDGELADIVVVDGLQSVSNEVLEGFYEILTRKEIPLEGTRGSTAATIEDIKKLTSKGKGALSNMFSFLVYQSNTLRPLPQIVTNRFMMRIPLPEKLRPKTTLTSLLPNTSNMASAIEGMFILPELCNYMREVIVRVRTGGAEEEKTYYVAAGPDPSTYIALEKAVKFMAFVKKKDYVIPACITEVIFFVLNHRFVYKQENPEMLDKRERWLCSGRGIDNYIIIDRILKSIPFPV